MRCIVAEQSIATQVASGRDGLIVVPRGRRRMGSGWTSIQADRVVDSLMRAGPGAVVLARDIDGDPAAGVLPELARSMDRDLVLLHPDPGVAAWLIGVALHRDFRGSGLVRRLETLVGVTINPGAMPRRRIPPGGASVPALRPAALSKWAERAWHPCERCPGGGPAGGRCGRCGAPGIVRSSR